MKYLLGAMLAIVFLGTSPASAEPFTFTATGPGPEMNGVETPDGMVGIVTLKSAGQTTYASGETVEWTSECQSLAGGNMNFDSQGFCKTMMDEENSMDVIMVCNQVAEGENDCWGTFVGGTGDYEGVSGTLTWQSKAGDAMGGGNMNVPEAE